MSKPEWREIWNEIPPWHDSGVQEDRKWMWTCGGCGEHRHHADGGFDRHSAIVEHVARKHSGARPVITYAVQQEVPCKACPAAARQSLEGWL